MTHWKVAWGVMFILGISSAPLLAYGQVEGSMSGQPSHEKPEKAGKTGMTKEEGTQKEGEKVKAVEDGTTSPAHEDEKSGQRQMPEGSH
jgi:hypothetical protein